MFSILVDFCPRFLSLRFHFTFSEDCRKIQRGIKHLSNIRVTLKVLTLLPYNVSIISCFSYNNRLDYEPLFGK